MSIVDSQMIRLKKAHIALMRQPSTALYSGVLLMGKNEVTEGEFTAYTDGVNKRYSAQFLATLTEPEVRALVLHENLHVALNHMVRGKRLFEESVQLTKMATDFAVNSIIMGIRVKLQGTDEPLLKLPDGGLYDPMFDTWSLIEIFEYLKKNCEPEDGNNPDPSRKKPGGEGSGGNQSPDNGQDANQGEVTVNGKKYDLSKTDEHDMGNAKTMDAEAMKKHAKAIEDALRQGGILAGRMGAKIPRAISESLEPVIRWQEVLRDFVSSYTSGKDEYTWRKYNRRLLANDLYLPSVMNETVGEVVIGFDTSASIDDKQIAEMAAELASVCGLCQPELVRVLWWDTKVHSEQVFRPDQYDQIKTLLKPQGGGGTRAGCVSDYINEKRINAECVIMFTDGYIEGNPKWTITHPTLWVITQVSHFSAPAGGRVVKMEDYRG